MKSTYTFRDMLPGEKDAVIAVSKTSPATSEFGYLWRLWGYWDSSPPIVAVEKKAGVVGFRSYVFNKRGGYVNAYYQAVLPEHRRKGLARGMMGRLLERAGASFVRRLKVKSSTLESKAFWEGFGLKPFAVAKNGEYMFDCDIGGISTLESWVKWNTEMRDQHRPIPPKALAMYLKKGAKLL